MSLLPCGMGTIYAKLMKIPADANIWKLQCLQCLLRLLPAPLLRPGIPCPPPGTVFHPSTLASSETQIRREHILDLGYSEQIRKNRDPSGAFPLAHVHVHRGTEKDGGTSRHRSEG